MKILSLRQAILSAVVALTQCANPSGLVQTGQVNVITDSDEKLAVVQGGPALGKQSDRLQLVAAFSSAAMPAGVTLSKAGRIFLSFPRWADKVQYTAVELVDGKLVPFPDADINMFDPSHPEKYDVKSHLVSVQSLVFDDKDRLWLLDPGSINFTPRLDDAPKLLCYDVQTRRLLKDIRFPNDVALKMTYLNDVRFDLSAGPEGMAYITDSGVGGIITVDLSTGKSWRHLDGHPSVLAETGLKQNSEGKEFMERKPSGEISAPDLRSDGIALSPDKKTLYYTPVVSRSVYSVPTSLLNSPDTLESELSGKVTLVANKVSGNDGIITGSNGQIYSTDFEDSAIRSIDPKTGTSKVLTQDQRLIWPDTLAVHDGWLYIVSNQLARQANYHFGKDQRQPPYALFKVKIDG